MSFRTRTAQSVSLHALATVVVGGAFGWIGGLLGAQLASDAASWAAIGYAVLGVLVGVIIGSYGTAVILGRMIGFRGSALFALLGAVIGGIGLVLALRLWSETPAGPILGIAFFFIALLVGYHAPWRT